MAIARGGSAAARRAEVVARLTARRPEIERLANEAIERVEPNTTVDLSRSYTQGVEQAVGAVLDYVLISLSAGSATVAPVPLMALDQARRAAKVGLGLDTVLRRYTAGDRALRRVLASELSGLEPLVVDDVHTLTEEAIDTVMEGAAAEFDAEITRLSKMADPMLTTTLGLLNEEIVYAELDGYVIDRWHIGLVTESEVSTASLSRLAGLLDAQLLTVSSQLGQLWVWLGGGEATTAVCVERTLLGIIDHPAVFGLGEPRAGLAGWRLTHLEARSAAELPNADDRPVTRMRSHVLEAAVLENKAFAESLLATYVEPLERESPKPAAELRRTMLAYLSSGQNPTSAAQNLGIDRHTVLRRVRKVEELVGERVEECFAQLDTALRIDANSDRPGRRGSLFGH